MKRQRDRLDQDGLQMTSMVDVTLLLLVFFMVTASFTTQKAMEQPALSNDPAQGLQQPPACIEIFIDQFSTYRLCCGDQMTVDAASDQEMRSRLRDLVERINAMTVVIVPDGDATHEKVVTAWDAARDNNVLDVVIRPSFNEGTVR